MLLYSKKKLYGRRYPIAQIKSKLSQLENHKSVNMQLNVDILKQENKKKFDHIKLNLKRDCFCMTEAGVVIKVTHIVNSTVTGTKFKLAVDQDSVPLSLYWDKETNINSRNMEICILRGLEEYSQQMSFNYFDNCVKCIVYKIEEDGSRFVAMPLLHQKLARVGPF